MNPTAYAVIFPGLDGSNPLAFLAALGTFRVLTLALPDERVCMRWQELMGAWRPMLTTEKTYSEKELIEILDGPLKAANSRVSFSVGDNLNVSSFVFREHLIPAFNAFARTGNRDDLDFFAAFGCEACTNDEGVIEDTDLRTMSGGGHQHFLKFFRELIERTEPSHIRRALLQLWDYADDGRGLNLRWDPADDRRYAMRWDDPSGDPIKTMRGANRLAIEALPLLPTMPTVSGLATTCFEGTGARDTFFVWPIWSCDITVDVVRSLLAKAIDLRNMNESDRAAIGVSSVFSSQRITTGKYRNFTPAQAV